MIVTTTNGYDFLFLISHIANHITQEEEMHWAFYLILMPRNTTNTYFKHNGWLASTSALALSKEKL